MTTRPNCTIKTTKPAKITEMALVCRKMPYHDSKAQIEKLTQSESPPGRYTEQNLAHNEILVINNSDHISDILVIEPVEDLMSKKEHLRDLHKAFCIKHSTQIRKRLFLAALNKGMQKQEQTSQESSSLVKTRENDDNQ